MINNIHLKKILRDYNYLYESLADTKEISSTAEGEFRTAMVDSGDKDAMKALLPSEKQQKQIEDIEKIEEDKHIPHDDKDFKKIFRKVVIKCHPDKIKDVSEKEASILKDYYEKVTKANDDYDWGLLLRIAGLLEIEDIILTPEQVNSIQKQNNKMSNEIEKYENSLAYQWYIKNDKGAKDRFLKICIEIFKKSLNQSDQ